jgi:hypothetical protein
VGRLRLRWLEDEENALWELKVKKSKLWASTIEEWAQALKEAEVLGG